MDRLPYKCIFSKLSVICLIISFFVSCKALENQPKVAKATSCKASTCHPSTPLREALPRSGKHNAHINKDVACENCHNGYLNNAFHKNGFLEKDTNNKIVFFDNSNPDLEWNFWKG